MSGGGSMSGEDLQESDQSSGLACAELQRRPAPPPGGCPGLRDCYRLLSLKLVFAWLNFVYTIIV